MLRQDRAHFEAGCAHLVAKFLRLLVSLADRARGLSVQRLKGLLVRLGHGHHGVAVGRLRPEVDVRLGELCFRGLRRICDVVGYLLANEG